MAHVFRFRAVEGTDDNYSTTDGVVLEIPPALIGEIKRELDMIAECEAASPVEPGTVYTTHAYVEPDPATSTLLSALAKWRDSYGCDQSFEGSEDARLAHAFDAWRSKR